MRRKKGLIGLVVFIFILCISIGFAIVSKTLTISGTSTSADESALKENFIVKFSNVNCEILEQSENGSVGNTTHATTNTNMQCSLSLDSMVTKGAYIIYTNNIVNESELYGASLAFNVEATQDKETVEVEKLSEGVYQVGDYYKITVSLGKTNLTKEDQTTVSFHIEMTKTPIEDLDSVTITVTFTATAVEIE